MLAIEDFLAHNSSLEVCIFNIYFPDISMPNPQNNLLECSIKLSVLILKIVFSFNPKKFTNITAQTSNFNVTCSVLIFGVDIGLHSCWDAGQRTSCKVGVDNGWLK